MKLTRVPAFTRRFSATQRSAACLTHSVNDFRADSFRFRWPRLTELELERNSQNENQTLLKSKEWKRGVVEAPYALATLVLVDSGDCDVKNEANSH